MIDQRLIICQQGGFHFSWMNDEFRKYFREVVITSDPGFPAAENDVQLVNAHLSFFQEMKCRQKFGILFAGFGFHPYKRPEQFEQLKPLFEKYTGIFCHAGPVWEAAKRDGTCKNFHLVPFGANTRVFRKTRKRDKFRRLIQVAARYEYKGRHLSRQAMELLPYEWEIFPADDGEPYLPYATLPAIYQQADGFLHPDMIGPPPGYFIDGKYTATTCEAALSGCIIFWHDAMGLGKDLETTFEVSLNPQEMATKIREVVESIDLDRHSSLTEEEFRDRFNIERAVKSKMEVIERFL